MSKTTNNEDTTKTETIRLTEAAWIKAIDSVRTKVPPNALSTYAVGKLCGFGKTTALRYCQELEKKGQAQKVANGLRRTYWVLTDGKSNKKVPK